MVGFFFLAVPLLSIAIDSLPDDLCKGQFIGLGGIRILFFFLFFYLFYFSLRHDICESIPIHSNPVAIIHVAGGEHNGAY